MMLMREVMMEMTIKYILFMIVILYVYYSIQLLIIYLLSKDKDSLHSIDIVL